MFFVVYGVYAVVGGLFVFYGVDWWDVAGVLVVHWDL